MTDWWRVWCEDDGWWELNNHATSHFLLCHIRGLDLECLVVMGLGKALTSLVTCMLLLPLNFVVVEVVQLGTASQ